MFRKAFFIMILSLLAALNGAAQEAFAIYKGATTNHNVDNHPGSSYEWGIFVDFSPDINAPPENYTLLSPGNSSTIRIQWNEIGMYYLKVTETDFTGCSNVKVIPVEVNGGIRSIGFASSSDLACYNEQSNGFSVPVKITGPDGNPLTADYFPVVVEFTVNGKGYSQETPFNNQIIQIPNNWLSILPSSDYTVKINITASKDIKNSALVPALGQQSYERKIMAVPKLEFETSENAVKQGLFLTQRVKLVSGQSDNSVFQWSLSPPGGTSTDLTLLKNSSASILMDGPPGIYTLSVSVTDGNGCFSKPVSKQVEITEYSGFAVNAGRDTVIGSCNQYRLLAIVDQQPGETYTYNWQPSLNIDNPNIADPVFTPGKTTTFVVTATNSKNVSVSDTVTVTVSELTANAGENIYMEQNSSVLLNGTASGGSDFEYKWTTNNGKIDSGETSARPIVSGFGTYLLTVTNDFGCKSVDSVNVFRLTHAPVAKDDYDTTQYQTTVKINVLVNDTHLGDTIVPSTLAIQLSPVNGTAYVDFNDYTINYRPNQGFSGNDNFEYRICNAFNDCDNAKVFVLVNDFKFMIPDAFSPNGDGINDYFEILGIENYEGNSITIINRWGNKVYEARNYGISTTPIFWDGKSNVGLLFRNEDLPAGTYYYILKLGKGENTIGGSIYLDR